MPSAKPARFPGIQMLRGLAVLLVVECHVGMEFGRYADASRSAEHIAAFGTSGVDIFFVISGFIIFLTAFGSDADTVSAGRFLLKRFIRIYPVYWCALVISVALGAAGGLSGLSPADLAGTIALLPLEDPVLGVSWTLSYEIFFYSLVALCMLVRDRERALLLIIVLLSTALATAPLIANPAWREFLGYSVMLEFAFGCCLAYAMLRWGERILPPVWVAAPALLAIAAAPWLASHASYTAPEPRVLIWGVAATLLVASALRIGEPRSAVARAAVGLGDASYAIYLFHPICLVLYGRVIRTGLLSGPGMVALGALAFALAVGLGIMVHRTIERPLLRGIRGLASGRPVAQAVAA